MAEEKNETEEKSSEDVKTQKKLTRVDIEKKIVALAEKGLTSEKIGLELKKLGIKPKDYPKRISQILKENNLYKNPDKINLEKKLKNLQNHVGKNKQDKRSIRESVRYQSKLRKIGIYSNK